MTAARHMTMSFITFQYVTAHCNDMLSYDMIQILLQLHITISHNVIVIWRHQRATLMADNDGPCGATLMRISSKLYISTCGLLFITGVSAT